VSRDKREHGSRTSKTRRDVRTSESRDTHPVYLNVFLYIVVYYRLIIYLLNDLISLYMARMSCYRGVVYKLKYLKL